MEEFQAIAEGARRVRVKVGRGNLAVRTGEGWTLEWKGDAPPIIERDGGNELLIKTEDSFWRGRLDLWLTLPRGIEEGDYHTGSGNVSGVGLAGEVRLHTGNGNIVLNEFTGEIKLDSGSGNIEVNESNGELYVNTGQGNLRLVNIGGEATAKTGHGNITLAMPHDLEIELKTGNGNLQIEGGSVRECKFKTGHGNIKSTANIGGNAEVETAHGNIEIGLPANLQARIEMQTGHGNTYSDFPVVRVGRPGPVGSGGRMVGNTGDSDGYVTVSAKTSHGNIAIRRQGNSAVVIAYPTAPHPAVLRESPPPAESYNPAMYESAPPPEPQSFAHAAFNESAPSPEPPTPPFASAPQPAFTPAPPAPPTAQMVNPTMMVLEALSRGEISTTEADVLLNRIRQQ